jgi:hypothetical protein
MKERWQRNKKWLLPACYLLLLVLWLAGGLVRFALDRAFTETRLPLDDALSVDVVTEAEGRYRAVSVDPQLVFTAGVPVRQVHFDASFVGDTGEMALYYAKDPGAFSPSGRCFGRLLDGGGYLYTLPPGRYAEIRLDPGTQNDLAFTASAVTLNPRLPLFFYYSLTARSILYFLLLPALASCLIYIIIELIMLFSKQRKRESGTHG